MSEKTTIGFVGAGLMGHGMAKNIVENGYGLLVMGHRNREPVEDLISRGAKEAETLQALASGSDMVFLCLPGSPQVEGVVFELLEGMASGTTIIDCSTANPVSTRMLAEKASEKGVRYVDAPLSRTPKEAWEGTLDVMVGCAEGDLDTVMPVLETFAGRVVRVGETGAGHTMKLLNNFVSLG